MQELSLTGTGSENNGTETQRIVLFCFWRSSKNIGVNGRGGGNTADEGSAALRDCSGFAIASAAVLGSRRLRFGLYDATKDTGVDARGGGNIADEGSAALRDCSGFDIASAAVLGSRRLRFRPFDATNGTGVDGRGCFLVEDGCSLGPG